MNKQMISEHRQLYERMLFDDVIPFSSLALEAAVRSERIGSYPKVYGWRWEGILVVDCRLVLVGVSCPISRAGAGSGSVLSL